MILRLTVFSSKPSLKTTGLGRQKMIETIQKEQIQVGSGTVLGIEEVNTRDHASNGSYGSKKLRVVEPSRAKYSQKKIFPQCVVPQ